MSRPDFRIQLSVNPETEAKLDLLAIKLALLSGVDWDTTREDLSKVVAVYSGTPLNVQMQIRAGKN